MSGYWVQISEFRHRWYPSEEAYKRAIGELSGESHLYVIDDTMPAVEHPCDGKKYDSKSEFRRVTKANGCVEVGYKLSELPDREPTRIPKEEIQQAIHRSLDIHGHRKY